MLVARQEDLGFDALRWERKVIRAKKIADRRVPLPARSGYISVNRGTVLEKSRRGRAYPAVFRTRQGESGRRPISCVRFTLYISGYPAVSRFDQGIPCCDVYPQKTLAPSRARGSTRPFLLAGVLTQRLSTQTLELYIPRPSRCTTQ